MPRYRTMTIRASCVENITRAQEVRNKKCNLEDILFREHAALVKDRHGWGESKSN